VEIIIFYIPFGSIEEATASGSLAIEKHLAACANIFPMQSIFPWEGQMQHDHEIVLILKTIPALKDQLRDFIASVHTYETPAILSWPVEVNDAYGRWISEQIREIL
jgi:periplasmic divalent cation tolerance protein